MIHMSEHNIVVIIDVFRAFTTACHVLSQHPREYIYAKQSQVLSNLFTPKIECILIGKNEIGAAINYDIPNSPTHVDSLALKDKTILHRSEAGAAGVLDTHNNDIVFAAALVNAKATVKAIQSLPYNSIRIVPMGHEAQTPSLEDDICAEYINALIHDRKYDIHTKIPEIINGPGQYFVQADQWQYPLSDLRRCLTVDRFDFAIQVKLHGNYASMSIYEEITKTQDTDALLNNIDQ